MYETVVQIPMEDLVRLKSLLAQTRYEAEIEKIQLTKLLKDTEKPFFFHICYPLLAVKLTLKHQKKKRPHRSKAVDSFETGSVFLSLNLNSESLFFMIFGRLQLLKIDPYTYTPILCLWIYLCFSTEKLDVRLGYDLCREEQEFLHKRRRVVASALKRVLHLERDLHGHEVCELESNHWLWVY